MPVVTPGAGQFLGLTCILSACPVARCGARRVGAFLLPCTSTRCPCAADNDRINRSAPRDREREGGRDDLSAARTRNRESVIRKRRNFWKALQERTLRGRTGSSASVTGLPRSTGLLRAAFPGPRQGTVSRHRPVAELPRAPRAQDRDHSPSRRLRRRPFSLQLARLRPRQQGKGHASRRRRVHPPVSPACPAEGRLPDPPLRAACQPPSCRQARPVLGDACPAGARAARTGIRAGAGVAPEQKSASPSATNTGTVRCRRFPFRRRRPRPPGRHPGQGLRSDVVPVPVNPHPTSACRPTGRDCCRANPPGDCAACLRGSPFQADHCPDPVGIISRSSSPDDTVLDTVSGGAKSVSDCAALGEARKEAAECDHCET